MPLVCSHRLGGTRWKHSPNDLLVMIEKEVPPTALPVLPAVLPASPGLCVTACL